jgi:hypothetical protein
MATVIAAHAMLNPQLECSVCYQMFTDPRILPCGHTFCLKCLQDIVKAVESNSHKIPCPTCRAEFQVGSQNLQDLPKNTISNKCDGMIRNICFAIKNLSANHDTVQEHIDTLLTAAEAKLQSLFDELLQAIKQCRDTAEQTVRKSHSEQMDKLQTSLADKQTQAHNIKQHVASVEHHLTPSSSVFDKSTFINDKLSDIESETRQAKIPLSTYLHTDISKWKTDMTTWLKKISDALTTATTQLPQLTEHSLVTHRFDTALSIFNT